MSRFQKGVLGVLQARYRYQLSVMLRTLVIYGKRRLLCQSYTCCKILSHASESGVYLNVNENLHLVKGSETLNNIYVAYQKYK